MTLLLEYCQVLDPSRWALGVGLKAGSSKQCFKFGLEAHRAAL